MEENTLAQVLYFPVKHFPSYLEFCYLEEIQMEMRHTYWLIEKEEKSKYQQVLRKQMLANRLRYKWELIVTNNDKGE